MSPAPLMEREGVLRREWSAGLTPSVTPRSNSQAGAAAGHSRAGLGPAPTGWRPLEVEWRRDAAAAVADLLAAEAESAAAPAASTDPAATRQSARLAEAAEAAESARSAESAGASPLRGLSPAWRALLLSDGSVTRHLRLLTLRDVRVECLEMRVLADLADAEVADACGGSLAGPAGLPVETCAMLGEDTESGAGNGDAGPLLQRQVHLRHAGTGEVRGAFHSRRGTPSRSCLHSRPGTDADCNPRALTPACLPGAGVRGVVVAGRNSGAGEQPGPSLPFAARD